MRNGCWPPESPRPLEKSHLHGTWPGGRAPSSCSQLLREHHRQSWGHHGPAVLLDLLSSISCRSEGRAMCQRHVPKREACQVALQHESPGSIQLLHLLAVHLRTTTYVPGTAPGLQVDSKQERLTSYGSYTPVTRRQTFHS